MDSESDRDKSKRVLREIVEGINRLWVGGNADKLSEFFHEDMIIVSPDLKKMGQGRDQCVQGYIDFSSKAKTLNYRESDFEISVWGYTAMVNYAFEISYEIGGKRYDEKGRDLFMFSFDGGEDKWLAVWRMIVPER